MTNTKRVLFLIIGCVILILGGIANYAYPKGESYTTGKYVQLGDERHDSLEYEQLPSPGNNPGWVQFVQDNDDILLLVLIVMVVVAGTWDSKKEQMGIELL